MDHLSSLSIRSNRLHTIVRVPVSGLLVRYRGSYLIPLVGIFEYQGRQLRPGEVCELECDLPWLHTSPLLPRQDSRKQNPSLWNLNESMGLSSDKAILVPWKRNQACWKQIEKFILVHKMIDDHWIREAILKLSASHVLQEFYVLFISSQAIEGSKNSGTHDLEVLGANERPLIQPLARSKFFKTVQRSCVGASKVLAVLEQNGKGGSYFVQHLVNCLLTSATHCPPYVILVNTSLAGCDLSCPPATVGLWYISRPIHSPLADANFERKMFYLGAAHVNKVPFSYAYAIKELKATLISSKIARPCPVLVYLSADTDEIGSSMRSFCIQEFKVVTIFVAQERRKGCSISQKKITKRIVRKDPRNVNPFIEKIIGQVKPILPHKILIELPESFLGEPRKHHNVQSNGNKEPNTTKTDTRNLQWGSLFAHSNQCPHERYVNIPRHRVGIRDVVLGFTYLPWRIKSHDQAPLPRGLVGLCEVPHGEEEKFLTEENKNREIAKWYNNFTMSSLYPWIKKSMEASRKLWMLSPCIALGFISSDKSNHDIICLWCDAWQSATQVRITIQEGASFELLYGDPSLSDRRRTIGFPTERLLVVSSPAHHFNKLHVRRLKRKTRRSGAHTPLNCLS